MKWFDIHRIHDGKRFGKEKSVKVLLLVGIITVMIVLPAGCQEETSGDGDNAGKQSETAEPTEVAKKAGAATAAHPPGSHAGTVKETMNSGGYTYLLIDTGDEEVWVASPQVEVAAGDEVVAPPGALMPGYTSPTLERTFDQIYFISSIEIAGRETSSAGDENQLPAGHPTLSGGGTNAGQSKTDIDLTSISKADGGFRVSEIYAQSEKLSDQEVAVRGKVVKFTAAIMGTNWVHLRDGSGGEADGDLTVTTSATVKVGDMILVKGKLSVDRDFGYGYLYQVIIEDGAIIVE